MLVGFLLMANLIPCVDFAKAHDESSAGRPGNEATLQEANRICENIRCTI